MVVVAPSPVAGAQSDGTAVVTPPVKVHVNQAKVSVAAGLALKAPGSAGETLSRPGVPSTVGAVTSVGAVATSPRPEANAAGLVGVVTGVVFKAEGLFRSWPLSFRPTHPTAPFFTTQTLPTPAETSLTPLA